MLPLQRFCREYTLYVSRHLRITRTRVSFANISSLLCRTTCGHSYCGPCLRREFEAQLRVTLWRLNFFPYPGPPHTREERDRLAQSVSQHNYEPRWVFQYHCPRPDCRTMIVTEPSIDQKLQGMLEALLEAVSDRFRPPIYTAELEQPMSTSMFCGLFLGAEGEE